MKMPCICDCICTSKQQAHIFRVYCSLVLINSHNTFSLVSATFLLLNPGALFVLESMAALQLRVCNLILFKHVQTP